MAFLLTCCLLLGLTAAGFPYGGMAERSDEGVRLLRVGSASLRGLAPGSAWEGLSARTGDSTRAGFIELDGSRLRYVVEGHGTPCLVIGSSVYYPKTFSAALRERLRFYFVDLKWFAEDYAPEPLESMTIESIVEDVEEIRTALGLEQPILLGHSIHGTIALEYVKRYPEHVSGVIAIGSPSQWGNESFEREAAELWASASDERKALQQENWGSVTELDRLTGKEATVAAYNRSSPQYWYDPTYDAGWLWDGMTVHTEMTDHLFAEVFSGYDLFAEATEIKVPMLVAMGAYDYVIPHTLWRTEYASIPDYTLVVFDHSGHTPQLEEPDAFDRALLEWLERLR